MTLYRAVQVDGQPCLVVMDCHLPDPQPTEGREANALRRLLAQYHEELSRDYVTGADVQYVFRDVCAHRVLLKQDAVGADVDSVLGELLKKVENPDRHGLLSGMFKR